jgi:hypothetical protein
MTTGVGLIFLGLFPFALQGMMEMFTGSVWGEDAMFRVHNAGFKILGIFSPICFISGCVVILSSALQ